MGIDWAAYDRHKKSGMKICILSSMMEHGGVSIIARDVAKGMAQKGHAVHFVCSGDASRSYKQEGYHVHILGIRGRSPAFHYFNPSLLARLYGLLSKLHPDVIHVHNVNLQSFSLGTLLLSRRYPMVWTIHDLWALCMIGWPEPPDCKGMMKNCRNCPTWPPYMVRLNKILKECVFRMMRCTVVAPSHWAASLLKVSVLGRHPLHIAHNGIDTQIFLSPSHQRGPLPEIPPDRKVLLFCGGKILAGQYPAERKGWPYLLEALRRLAAKRSDFHLLYVGDPLPISSGASTPITFVGPVLREDMKFYYDAADVFILPTLADNSPLTVLEAMACKTPIVASRVGGIPEAIVHGESGLLCPPRSVEGLASAIDLLLSKEDLRAELARNAHQRFLHTFTFEHMIDHYERVYRETISRKSRA